jgi:hypothetical protein
MALFLLISAQALLLLLIASLLYTFPRPLSTPLYIVCLVLVLVAVGFALALDNQTSAIFDTLEFLSIVTAIIVLVVGLVLTIRKTSKNRSAWLSVLGFSLFVMTIGITLIEARNDLRDMLDEGGVEADSTEMVIISTPTSRETARQILDNVAIVIAQQTGLPADEVTLLLDGGASVASLISEHGGDLEIAITEITTIMSNGIQEMARNGQMDESAASFALASMPTIVRLGVNSSLNGMLARFDTPESTPAP